MKIFLLLIIVLLCGYMGFYLAKKYSARVKLLELCELMLIKIKVYIECENMKTAEIITRLADGDSLRQLSFLKKCADKLAVNKNFPLMWCESLDEASAELALTREDFDILKQLAEVVGVCDSAGVADSIEVLRCEIEQVKEQATLLNQTTGSLCRKLGVLAGVAVGIILI